MARDCHHGQLARKCELCEYEQFRRDAAAFMGDEWHHGWAAYVAANLRQALKIVPDTGDWHGALRTWCDRFAGDTKPNATAEEMVTDAMAERAARAWEGDDIFDSYDKGFKAEALADARHALLAALGSTDA